MKKIIIFIICLWSYNLYGQCNYGDTAQNNSVSAITATTATVTADEEGSGGGVQLSNYLTYVRVGYTDSITASGSAANLTRYLTGLIAASQYYYYYSTVCTSGIVRQQGPYYFTTLTSTVAYAPERPTVFNYLKVDTSIIIPQGDTTIGRAPATFPQIKYKTSNNTFYGYYPDCICWRPLAIDSSGIIALLDGKVDSVTVSGDSLFYWKVGVSYGYILPSVATVWHTDGNTVVSGDFLGSINAEDLVIKTNNTEAMRINTSKAVSFDTDFGTAGYILQSAGSGGPPVWSSPSSVAVNIYNADDYLTSNRILKGAGSYSLTFDSLTHFYVNRNAINRILVTPTQTLLASQNNGAFLSMSSSSSILQTGGSNTIKSDDGASESNIVINAGSIEIKPDEGVLIIDTLAAASSQTHLLGWTETAGANRGKVGSVVVGSGLSLSSGTLTATGGSLTSTYIGYGSAGNALTGDANLTYTAAESAVVIDSGYLSFTGHKNYGSTVAGSIFKHSDYGLTTRAITGSTYDWLMFSTGGNTVLANPTGTDNFLTSGKWGFGSLGLTPTAKVQIAAGSATANTAPLQLTTGPVETVARAGVMEYTTPQLFFTNGAAVRQELFQGQQARVSTQYDNTTTTLGDITGLTSNVAAGKIYRFEARLYTTSDVAGGIKVAIAGTATATAIRYEGLTTDAGLTTQSRSAALGTAVGAVTAVTAAYVTITGTITVNAAGTLTVQAAANAATGTTSVLTGSTFIITEML